MERRLLILILLLALALRLGWGLSRPATDDALRPLPDQLEYLTLGRNLLAGNGLTMHDQRLEVDVRAYRTPGYPVVVALCGGNVRAIRIAQAVLGASTVLAAYLLARRWLAPRASLVAAAIVAVNPFLIYFDALILSETLFIALLAWGMTLLARRQLWPGIVILALSALVRPSAAGLPVLLAVASSSRHRARAALAAAAITFIVLLPWAWRNHRAIGHWVFTSTNSGVTLYDGLNPSATGASNQGFVMAMADQLRGMDEFQRSRFLSTQAMQFVREHPLQALSLALRKIGRTWSPVPLNEQNRTHAAAVAVSAIYCIALFAGMVIGLWQKTLPAAAKVLLLLPAIYFTAAHAISIGSLRYRLPADVPISVIAAAAFISGRWSKASGQRTLGSDD